MTYLNKIAFSTERMHLRVLEPKTYEELFTNHNDDFIMSYLGFDTVKQLETEREKYKHGLACHDRTFEIYQMIDKESNQLLGMTGFVRWWPKHFRAEIGYGINKAFEGKGYTTEATMPLIEYGFNQLGLKRIEALTGPENIASQKIINKLGMQEEGFLRNHYVIDGIAHHSIMYSILKEEWKG